MGSGPTGTGGFMDYSTAHEMASKQGQPVRRSSWPTGHHVRGDGAESFQRVEGENAEASQWEPGEDDRNAKDWEQHVPEQHQR